MSSEKRRRTINFKASDDTPTITTTTTIEDPLAQLRSSWEVAALWQFTYMFRDVLKLPKCEDTEQLERELLDPVGGQLLPELQLALLKNVSSQRGLTIDQFEDYTRRQYMWKDPDSNPFGNEEDPAKFTSFDAMTRCKVLYQICMWILYNTDRFREKHGHPKDIEQQEWRIDPIGWDAKGNTYYTLDNNRLYCRTEPPIPIIQKAKTKARRKSGKGTKRRKSTTQTVESDEEEDLDKKESDPLAKMEWKCVCASLEDYRSFIAKFEKSRNIDEKELHQTILEEIIPIYEKEEARRQRRLEEQERERVREALLANRKRSSRIDEKLARKKEQDEREAEEAKSRLEHEKQAREERKIQEEQEEQADRLRRREHRLELREARRKQLATTGVSLPGSEDGTPVGSRASSRIGDRRRRQVEQEVEELDNWMFDCICGVHGPNFDDGTHSIACDECGIWQHTACLNIGNKPDDEDFICNRCVARRHIQEQEQTQSLNILQPHGITNGGAAEINQEMELEHTNKSVTNYDSSLQPMDITVTGNDGIHPSSCPTKPTDSQTLTDSSITTQLPSQTTQPHIQVVIPSLPPPST